MNAPMKRWGLWLLLGLAWMQPAQAQTVVRYYHTDALGSVVAVTDASGSVVERREYEPYGAQLTPAVQDGPGYTGHVQDAATGLVYMQQRYYDPMLGVFLSVDPIAANPNSGALFNRYMYAANNPYRFYDPDGRCTGSRITNSDGTCRSTGGFTTKSYSANRPQMNFFADGRQSSGVGAESSARATTQNNKTGQSATSTAKTLADANGMIASTRQNHLSNSGMWRGANGEMYSKSWGGNQHTGARSLALEKVNAFRVAGTGLFALSSVISVVDGVDALNRGDNFGAFKSGVDVGWGAAATYGGPAGLVGAASYTGTSLLIGIPTVREYTVEPATDLMCWGSGNC